MFAALTSVLAKLGISGVESKLAAGASWLCYYDAIQKGVLRVVVPIDKLSILVTVIFSRMFLGEKLTGKAGFGPACMCMGSPIMAIWT